jgi:3-hydroxybutyryl-CoA dehydrogenase
MELDTAARSVDRQLGAETALVIGGGTMGSGIARCLHDTGASVIVVESDPGGRNRARQKLPDGVEVTAEIPAGTNPSLVIEAIPEDVDAKLALLARVDEMFPEALLATNTSSLSIDKLSGALQLPDRFLGMHFFNPVPRSVLVELVIGSATSDDALEQARTWVAKLGKESIEVRDSPGFATSRLGLAIGLEAIRMVEEGVASAEDIDRGMVLGYKFPVGPLRLTDLVGLDVRLAIAEHLAGELGPRFEAPQLLRTKVAAGQLGKKSGQGFYEW